LDEQEKTVVYEVSLVVVVVWKSGTRRHKMWKKVFKMAAAALRNSWQC